MAERRMISKKVIDSDEFFELTDKAKAFYIYLILEADDDGFIGNLKAVTRGCGANAKTVESLVNQGLLLLFSDKVAVIAHWPMQNKVRSDRYTKTLYQKEFQQLGVVNGRYILKSRIFA